MCIRSSGAASQLLIGGYTSLNKPILNNVVIF